MLTLRRPEHEMRIEIMPLIDVIFLLLTFFIYAMVLMVRAELMPIKLQAYASSDPARTAPVATISILLDGSVHVNRSPVSPDDVAARLREIRSAEPATVIYLALEDGEGDLDRAPILTRLWDNLRGEGLEIHFVGRP